MFCIHISILIQNKFINVFTVEGTKRIPCKIKLATAENFVLKKNTKFDVCVLVLFFFVRLKYILVDSERMWEQNCYWKRAGKESKRKKMGNDCAQHTPLQTRLW